MTRRRWVVTALICAAILLIAGRLIADAYVDYAWYAALGATSVWSARLVTISISRTVAWVIASVFALAHFLTVRQSVASLGVQRRVGDLEIVENVRGRYLTASTVALAVVVGGILALAWNDWAATLLASSDSVFREFDPYFGADLGFYVYWLPFEAALWNWSLLVLCAVVAVVTILYVLTDGVRWDKRRFRASAHARRHLTVLAGMVLLLLAWSFRLDMYELLVHGSGQGGAFNFVDHRVRVPGTLALCLVTLGAGLCVIVAGIGGQSRLAASAIIGVIGLWIVIRHILPTAVVQIAGVDDQRQRDAPYLATQAAYTRRGFATDRIVPTDTTLQFRSLADAATRIPEWDATLLRRAVGAPADTAFGASWISWHPTVDELLAELISKPAVAGDEHLPWVTTIVRATMADRDGGPAYALRESPVADVAGSGQAVLREPLVYPGAVEYAVVPDTFRRVAGVPLESAASRVAHAWSLQNLRILGGSLPEPHPTVVSHRDVRDRLDRLVPFLSQGSAITPVIAGDTLYWLVDLYSASAWYPLSLRININQMEVGYYQHAAVAILNAATGDVSLVADSVLDPIARSWKDRFPGLFGSWDALPSSLRNDVPPASDGARAQAVGYGRVASATNSAARCRIPDRDGSDSLAGSGEAVFEVPSGDGTASAFPLVDDNERICGAVVAVGGARRRTAWQPARDNAERWPVVLNRLRTVDSSSAMAPQLAVVRGPVLVVPMTGHLLYLQSAYTLRPSGSASLAYVSYVDGDTARRVSSLEVLARGSNPLASASSKDTLGQAVALWTALQDAARRGDWVTWGRDFDALGRLLGSRIRPK